MEDYVEHIGELTVRIVAAAPGNVKFIQDLGGVAVTGEAAVWRVDYDNEDQLAKILQALRDAGMAFMGGSGWPPSGVAELLRDKGKLHGVIREAVWYGPDEQVIWDR